MEHTVPYLKVEGVDNQDPIFGDRYIAVSTSFLWHFFLNRIGETMHAKIKASKTKLPVCILTI
jgi:hypothetical protein